jgi:stearoyl-CoA desaturase (delta-9 desaturase)
VQNVIEFEPSRANKLNWSTIVFVTVFHMLAFGAVFTFSWSNLAALLLTLWVSGSLGIGVGYHRLFTHRGFKAPKWVQYVLATCGTLAAQSGPIAWVTTHRLHHAFTDTDKDPHSPRSGTYWSHIGWIFRGTAQLQPESVRQRYSPDLTRDAFLVWIDKYYYITFITVGVLLFAIGGWTMVLWGIVLRTVLSWHFTWLVNSATHLWGTQRFDSRDDSRNNGLVAAVSWGEGWHNNHHAYPRSARHGLTWKEVDINWMTIKLMEKLGLVTDVHAIDLAELTAEGKTLRQAA